MRFLKSTASVKSLTARCDLFDRRCLSGYDETKRRSARQVWIVAGRAIASGSHILSNIKFSAAPADGRDALGSLMADGRAYRKLF
jgi:hypothetical protein